MQALPCEDVYTAKENNRFMNKILNQSLIVGLSTLALTACSTSKKMQDSGIAAKPSQNMMVDKDYLVDQEEEEYLYLTAEQQNLIRGNNQFALNFFEKTVGMESYVASPLSITYLMSMLADGADGLTRQEMLNALGWHDAKLADVDALCRLLLEKSGKLDKSTTINIANYIALNKNFSLKKDYVSAVQQNYKAGIESLDFTSANTTQHINNWCKQQTDGMIPSIIDQVDPSAALYAMNAIFFNGSWADKFNKNLTHEENFRGYTRDIKKVQMMQMNNEFNYYDNDTLQAVQLPYGNGSYVMTILLPREGKTIDDIIKGIDAESLSEMRFQMDHCKVDLKLPRFTIEQKFDLNQVISSLGAPAMFSPSADFSKLSAEQLYVSKMIQKAKIEVTEEGTKAAAVTAAIMMMTSLNPPEPRRVSFHADHPFIYMITQQGSGAILFIGQYAG